MNDGDWKKESYNCWRCGEYRITRHPLATGDGIFHIAFHGQTEIGVTDTAEQAREACRVYATAAAAKASA